MALQLDRRCGHWSTTNRPNPREEVQRWLGSMATLKSQQVADHAFNVRSRSDKSSATVVNPGRRVLFSSSRSHRWTFFSDEMTVE